MTESDNYNNTSTSNAENGILNELKKSNELLENLLEIQRNVQLRQKKFWFMGLTQIVIIFLVLFWFGSKYGF